MKNLRKSVTTNNYMDALPGGVFVYKADDKGEITYVNDETLSIFGCSNRDEFDELTGGTFQGMVYPEDYEAVVAAIDSQVTEENAHFDHVTYRIKTKQGDILYIEDFGRLIDTPDLGQVYMVFIVDIRNKFNSYSVDSLTGLMGMRHFLGAVNERKELTQSQGIYVESALLYFNLLDFKIYNSVFGIDAGDECLRKVASILRDVFAGELIAHFSADNFVVLTSMKSLDEKIEKVHQRVLEINTQATINIKAGIRILEEKDTTIPVQTICDQAKIACDYIKKDGRKISNVFNDQLSRDMELRSYIVDHIRDAIRNGYIQIYYQPVARSLTGKLCGAEALSRWVDPNYGIISPALYVPLLEEAHMIHILDAFVIDEVGKQLRNELDHHRAVVPISFNLSRMDFLEGHPFERIERVVKKYQIRRDLIRCEITESTLMADKARMKAEIEHLHNAGYQVWMDDFGSGYSTLNILKEFEFDEVKIDMLFLRDLNDRGKQILKSIVSMAKDLGIHTLAEGAETSEQVDYLRKIGCERIQGYFYGKPQPYADMMQHCRDFGCVPETEAQMYVFDEAGLVNLNGSSPLALFADDGKEFEPLITTDEYMNVLSSFGTHSIEQMKTNLSNPLNPMVQKYRQLANRAIETRKRESMTFSDNGQFMRMSITVLSGFGGLYIYLVDCYNMTDSEDISQAREFDYLLRTAVQNFREIYLWNVADDVLNVLETTNPWEKAGEGRKDAMRMLEHFIKNNIYVDDQDRFTRFMDPDRIYADVEKNGLGFISEPFRVRQPDGNYLWLDFLAQVIFKSEGRPILLLVRNASAFDNEEIRENLIKSLTNANDYNRYTIDGSKWSMDGELWRNLMDNSNVYYFWKDRERRFMGASKSFLDAFEIKNIEMLLGKTDEDMGWHIDDEPFRRDELDVLEHGAVIRDSVGSCIIRGVPCTIMANKFPMYQDGKIIGLLGYFIDNEMSAKASARLQDLNYIDQVSGCLNYRGAVDAGIRMEESFKKYKKDFVGIIIDVPEYEHIYHSYGQEIADEMIRVVADKISKNATIDAVISRLQQCRFLIFDHSHDMGSIRKRITNLLLDLEQIHDVRGVSVTLNGYYTLAWRSEVKSNDALVYMLIERLAVAQKENFDQNSFKMERIVIDLEKLDDVPDNIYMADPENYDLLYLNNGMSKTLELPEDFRTENKKCYEVIFGNTKPCEFCSNDKCTRDKYYAWNYHSPRTGNDFLVRDTLISWNGRDIRYTTAINLSDSQKKLQESQEFIYQEMTINDAVNIAMSEKDSDVGIQKLLRKLAIDFNADRVYIFEDEPGDKSSNTYEYCKPGVSEQKANLQHVPKRTMRGFYDRFDDGQPVITYDIQEYKTPYPALYQNLISQDIHSVVAVQLRLADKRIGFIAVDNPQMGNNEAISLMLETLAKFVTFIIRERDHINHLANIGNTDQLTGVQNRTALKAKFKREYGNGKFVYIYGDLNGLKKVNDAEGHEAGDRLIKSAADLMVSIAGARNVYRLGGDEFLVIVEEQTQEEADALLKRIREAFDQAKMSIALGCVWTSDDSMTGDQILKEADRRMYLNKVYMHENME